jgi:prolyl-tRNA synthetase
LPRDDCAAGVGDLLADIQKSLLDRAEAFRREHTRSIDNRKEFIDFFTPANAEKPEIHGGFALSHWCGGAGCEAEINEKASVTIRCVPLGDEMREDGACIACGKPSGKRVVFAKSY